MKKLCSFLYATSLVFLGLIIFVNYGWNFDLVVAVWLGMPITLFFLVHSNYKYGVIQKIDERYDKLPLDQKEVWRVEQMKEEARSKYILVLTWVSVIHGAMVFFSSEVTNFIDRLEYSDKWIYSAIEQWVIFIVIALITYLTNKLAKKLFEPEKINK